MRNPQNKQKPRRRKMHTAVIETSPATAEDSDTFLAGLRDTLNQAGDGEEPTRYGLVFEYVEADTWHVQPEAYFRCGLSCTEPASELRFFVGADFSCVRVEFWIFERSLGIYFVKHIRDRESAAGLWSGVNAQFASRH
jgi:hypothetical protein